MRPSCLQTTVASIISQSSLHTVPHCLWKHTSTLPTKLFLPPTNWISVLLQSGSTDIRDKIFYKWIYFVSDNESKFSPMATLLWTDHSCIFIMMTVVVTNSTVSAIIQVCLISSAVNLIQEDGSNSRTKDPAIHINCYCICKLEKQQIINRISHRAASKLALKLKKGEIKIGYSIYILRWDQAVCRQLLHL